MGLKKLRKEVFKNNNAKPSKKAKKKQKRFFDELGYGSFDIPDRKRVIVGSWHQVLDIFGPGVWIRLNEGITFGDIHDALYDKFGPCVSLSESVMMPGLERATYDRMIHAHVSDMRSYNNGIDSEDKEESAPSMMDTLETQNETGETEIVADDFDPVVGNVSDAEILPDSEVTMLDGFEPDTKNRIENIIDLSNGSRIIQARGFEYIPVGKPLPEFEFDNLGKKKKKKKKKK